MRWSRPVFGLGAIVAAALLFRAAPLLAVPLLLFGLYLLYRKPA